jgi:hypothetical protein
MKPYREYVLTVGVAVGLVLVVALVLLLLPWIWRHFSQVGKHSTKRGNRDHAAVLGKVEQERRNDVWWQRGRESQELRGL